MTLRTGVVGAGIVASNNHFPALSRNPRTELTTVCDVDAESAAAIADEYGINAHTDVEELLAAESLDWVHVATPVQTHFDIGRRVLRAGVPVLLQKPATTTSDELTELIDLAADRGIPLSVVHNWLYYPSVRELRRRIADGEIGPVRAVQTTLTGEGAPDESYRGDWVFDLPGGSLEEGMPHPIRSRSSSPLSKSMRRRPPLSPSPVPSTRAGWPSCDSTQLRISSWSVVQLLSVLSPSAMVVTSARGFLSSLPAIATGDVGRARAVTPSARSVTGPSSHATDAAEPVRPLAVDAFVGEGAGSCGRAVERRIVTGGRAPT